MKLFIVTGASRGLGEAIVRKLMKPGHVLVGLSRGEAGGSGLRAEAQASGAELRWIGCDLNKPDQIGTVMERLFAELKESGDSFESACLINNAGVIEPIGPVGQIDEQLLARNLGVNLIAPIVMTSAFLRHTAKWQADCRVMNISSGAGRKPYAGWSAYCASKAGLDMFTRCVGEEKSRATIFSVAPGVIDTDMQAEIRGAKPEHFPMKDRFVGLKESGGLLSPEEAAEKLIRILFDDRVENGSLLDVRDFR